MDKHKILNSASVLFQNIFTYFAQLEEEKAADSLSRRDCKLKSPVNSDPSEVQDDKA
jgi:hypothetical protein